MEKSWEECICLDGSIMVQIGQDEAVDKSDHENGNPGLHMLPKSVSVSSGCCTLILKTKSISS
jgi:hypothetical protein